MGEVVSIFERAIAALQEPLPPDQAPIDAGGGSGDDGGMEARLSAVEKSMIRVETRMESLASKSDVAEAKFQIIIWVVSAVILAQLLPALLRLFKVG